MGARKKVVLSTAMILSYSLLFSTGNSIIAERVQGNRMNYSPVHLAIVMDASGSIASPTEEHPSDPQLISRESAKTLINELPTKENKIALFQYSDTVERVSDFASLDNKNNIDNLLESISGMTDCHGGTHMISAIAEARKYLEENAEENVKNVMVIFTDGAENGDINPDTASPDNISRAVKESLGDSDVIVYSVAFDYLDENGNHSISGSEGGSEGYGKLILDEYAKQTNGKVLINKDDITKLEEQFSSIVEDLCYVDIKNIDEFPGDGKEHITELDITDSVVEADIRISNSSVDAIKNGNIRLYNEQGKEVKLNNSSSDVWFNEDKISANIKIIHPNTGKWKLVVSDIVSKDSVKINLIEQYNMSLNTKITTEGNDARSGVVSGGTVNVETFLMSDGNLVSGEDMYNDPGTKAALYISKGKTLEDDFKNLKPEEYEAYLNKRDNVDIVNLISNGSSFAGNYVFDEPGDYLVSVLVNSDKYYCYEDYHIVVADEPVVPFEIEQTDKNPVDEIKTVNGESSEVPDLKSYTNDPKAKITVKKYDQDIIEPKIEDDKLVIKPVAPGSTEIVLKYLASDEGSYLDRKIKITVTNAPPVLGDIKDSYSISSGDTVLIDDIVSKVTDVENDALTYSIKNVSDSSIADITVTDGSVSIKSLKKGSTEFDLVISDGENEISKTIKVKVKASKKEKGIVLGSIAAVFAAAAAGILVFLNKSKRLHTALENPKIEVDVDGNGKIVTLNLGNSFEMKSQFKKENKITMHQLVKKMINEESQIKDLDPEAVDAVLHCEALKKIIITGDRNSKNPDIIKCQSDEVGLSDGVLSNYGRKINKSISNRKERETLVFCIGGKKTDGSEVTKIRIIFTFGS